LYYLDLLKTGFCEGINTSGDIAVIIEKNLWTNWQRIWYFIIRDAKTNYKAGLK